MNGLVSFAISSACWPESSFSVLKVDVMT